MPRCAHRTAMPAAFELRTAERAMRYVGPDGVIAAASRFGGRWRVTDPSGEPLFSLAPAGAPGTDDRHVVPNGAQPVAAIMRDRRRSDSWLVLDMDGEIFLRATLQGPYEMLIFDSADVVTARVWATVTAVIADFGSAPHAAHCLALALPLYFATTGALRVEQLTTVDPSNTSLV